MTQKSQHGPVSYLPCLVICVGTLPFYPSWLPAGLAWTARLACTYFHTTRFILISTVTAVCPCLAS